MRKRPDKYFADTRCADRLHGLKDTTIYVSNYGYWHMSVEFARECKARNLNIEIWID